MRASGNGERRKRKIKKQLFSQAAEKEFLSGTFIISRPITVGKGGRSLLKLRITSSTEKDFRKGGGR
jgi:hypothetical protein